MTVGKMALLSTYLTIILVSFTCTRGQLPDFASDHHTDDRVSVSKYQDNVYGLRYNNEDKPDHCRHDVCPIEFYETERKGNLTWPLTVVGYRQYVRCPYAVVEAVYAYRDCYLGYNENGTLVPAWGDMVTEHCPDTPLTEKLNATKTVVAWLGNDYSEGLYMAQFTGIMRTINTYYDQPIYEDNIVDIFEILNGCIKGAVNKKDIMESSTLEITFHLTDWLIKTHEVQFDARVLNFRQLPKVIWILTVLTEMSDPPPGDNTMTLQGQSAVITTLVTSELSVNNALLSTPGYWSSMTSDITLALPWKGRKVVRFLHLPLPEYFEGERILTSQASPPKPVNVEVPVVYVTVATTEANSDWRQRSWDERANSKRNVSVTYKMSHPEISDDQTFEDPLDDTRKCGNTAVRLVNPETGFDLRTWNGSSCRLLDSEDYDTTCQCTGSGFYAVFMPSGMLMMHGFYPPPPPRDVPEEEQTSTIAVFLGFPYQYGLYVTSHVFRALSLVCLVLTVISYVVHRKSRTGTPTKILLNLCASLIALLIALYIAEAIAYTKYGCRVSNVLRYYLVMVTLLWNGVEAVNMYLMLVRVFNKQIRHFTLKAAAVAWGLPFVPIIIIIIANIKGFDGVYSLECIFKCQLKPAVLYYGYLIPLGIILTFNIVVFGRVMCVLRQSKGHMGASKGKDRGLWLRLIGAMSIMVLLGIPWIFSAFGAIDAGDSNAVLQNTEAVFHVIFVICINLQGVFIFGFHCARNAEIREAWIKTITSNTSSSTSFSILRRSSDGGLFKSRRRSSQGDSMYSTPRPKSETTNTLLVKDRAMSEISSGLLQKERPTSATSTSLPYKERPTSQRSNSLQYPDRPTSETASTLLFKERPPSETNTLLSNGTPV